MDLKRRIERLENLAKTSQNDRLTLHDQNGNRLHGSIIKLPSKNEKGIAEIDGKEYPIAVDISISELLTLNLDVAQLDDLEEFKITPETLFLRKNNRKGGLEFKAFCIK